MRDKDAHTVRESDARGFSLIALSALLESFRLMHICLIRLMVVASEVAGPASQAALWDAVAVPSCFGRWLISYSQGGLLKRILLVVAASLAFLTILYFPLSGYPQTPLGQIQPLSDFQKEAIASIREITLQLILIAMGVFAVIGGFATAKERTFANKGLLTAAFLFLGVSVISGLLAYGTLIWSLDEGLFDPSGAIRGLAAVQWSGFGIGGLLFMCAVLSNVGKR